ncbi:endonuclease domain-containing protein [Oceanibaculum nanhaiense]|uniref:endonuclease domain-containing protein n=1 Tax=Oceanibaculum nanhaiense TaxID=1909734 RepID=UPI003D2D61BB
MSSGRARQLRRNMTEAEKGLWKVLRDRQISGCKFRRQQPIGPYIVDFVAFAQKLIVELDGGQHALDAQRDNVRTRYLSDCGYRVLRFWNHEAISNPQGVLQRIQQTLSPGRERVPPLGGG